MVGVYLFVVVVAVTTPTVFLSPKSLNLEENKSPEDDCYENDTEYLGNDFEVEETTTPSECQALCQQTDKCRYFTWSTPSCWLKTRGGLGKGKYLKGAFSGPRTCGIHVSDEYSKMEDGKFCSGIWTRIANVQICIAAADFLDLEWGGSYSGPGDFPGCQYTDDGRNKVNFNWNLNPSNDSSVKPKYAEICIREGLGFPIHIINTATDEPYKGYFRLKDNSILTYRVSGKGQKDFNFSPGSPIVSVSGHNIGNIGRNPSSDCYKIDTDYPGNDIDPQRTKKRISPSECQALCQQTDGCQYFTWFAPYCYLKSKGGVDKEKSLKGAVSGPRTCVIHGKLWRDDGRCGQNFTLANGDDGQCDPKGNDMTAPWGPCCSEGGWCGNTDAHCKCATCVDYSHSSTKPLKPNLMICDEFKSDGTRHGYYEITGDHNGCKIVRGI